MSEAAPGFLDGAVSPARARLAEATRHLVDAVMTADDATDDDLQASATTIEQLVESLTGVPAGRHPSGVRTPSEGQDHYLPRSPVVGDASPFAPPFTWEVRDGRAYARATLGAPYEGPPGYVHGGMIAMIFDEVLGMANIASGTPGMTGTLTVRYRRPTPLHRPVEVEGWVERVTGRRIMTRGSMFVDETLTAEASGTFISIDERLASEIFGREPDRPARAGDREDTERD